MSTHEASAPPAGRSAAHPWPSFAARMLPRAGWSLARQYAAASFAVLLLSMLVTGAWIGEQIQASVIRDAAQITALYTDAIVNPYLQPLARQPRLDDNGVAGLDRVLADTRLGQRVVAFKVWSREGEVLYSPNRQLIGRHFTPDAGLRRALGGEVFAEISDLDDEENEFERGRWQRLLSIYTPVRRDWGGEIIAVSEFYQLTDQLDAEIAAARWKSWGVVAALTALTYAILAGIVKRGSDTIGRQQTALARQVAELSRLNDRVRHAAGRTTTLNEQWLRRISADLHDGPGQALAFALLRLDALQAAAEGERRVPAPAEDLSAIESAVRGALGEVRAISGGLRLPELDTLPLGEVAGRAIRDHERRSGVRVESHLDSLPADAPPAVRVALYRSLQEALSNATRHGEGKGVVVRVWQDGRQLCLSVADRGPGFPADDRAAAGRLGLVGMRERAQLLGGEFRLSSEPGAGTTVFVCWPLDGPAAGDAADP